MTRLLRFDGLKFAPNCLFCDKKRKSVQNKIGIEVIFEIMLMDFQTEPHDLTSVEAKTLL
jgi:hypothetical protein